jgi:formylglycine-generating enzyme required for sulfatase activity
MGAIPPSSDHLAGTPNVDPFATSDESTDSGETVEVSLAPFFLSKYEVTQNQWLTVMGENPSFHGPGRTVAKKNHPLLHPVEFVSWNESARFSRQLGLVLPTEAQWEYAYRAGTQTIWFTGDEISGLWGAVNLRDRHLRTHGGPSNWRYEEALDDGNAVHAAVGLYRPNGFGLHDVSGNVAEWCRDPYASYDLSFGAADGAQDAPGGAERVSRGGGWGHLTASVRAAKRSPHKPDTRLADLGLRPARPLSD